MQKVLRYLSMPVFWIVAAVVLLVFVVFKFLVHGARSFGEQYAVDNSKLERESRFYKSIADQLEDAMQGAGTNEEEVLPLIQSLNDQELRHVVNVFGVRNYSDFYFGRIGPITFATPGKRIDLVGWLTKEFDSVSSDWKYISSRLESAGLI